MRQLGPSLQARAASARIALPRKLGAETVMNKTRDQNGEGGCLCGAVRYRVTGAPLWVAHCHCRSCQRATASAMTTYAGYGVGKFSVEAGEPARFNSSPGVTRSFCGRCGTPLAYESTRWPGEVHVFVCTLDDPERLTPRAHVHVAERLSWLHLNDGLREFQTTAGEA